MDALLALSRPLLAPAFTVAGSPFTWLELLACVLSIAMVLANMRVMVVGWPLAIVSSALYFLLFWDVKLYGDASLQVFFMVVALWGWWQWLRGRGDDGAPLIVRRLGGALRWQVPVAGLLLWPAVGWFLDTWTDSDVPWWDAFPTAFSLVGQWLLGRKYQENWAAWLLVNLVGTGLFAYKGLWLTTGLYTVFALMSVAGWRAWQRQLAAAAPADGAAVAARQA